MISSPRLSPALSEVPASLQNSKWWTTWDICDSTHQTEQHF